MATGTAKTKYMRKRLVSSPGGQRSARGRSAAPGDEGGHGRMRRSSVLDGGDGHGGDLGQKRSRQK
jgi:hypothetical protein